MKVASATTTGQMPDNACRQTQALHKVFMTHLDCQALYEEAGSPCIVMPMHSWSRYQTTMHVNTIGWGTTLECTIPHGISHTIYLHMLTAVGQGCQLPAYLKLKVARLEPLVWQGVVVETTEYQSYLLYLRRVQRLCFAVVLRSCDWHKLMPRHVNSSPLPINSIVLRLVSAFWNVHLICCF